MKNVASVEAVWSHPFTTSTRMWTGGGGVSLMWTSTQKIKIIESTDIIQSSSYAKKLAYFLPEFRLLTEKSGHFSAI